MRATDLRLASRIGSNQRIWLGVFCIYIEEDRLRFFNCSESQLRLQIKILSFAILLAVCVNVVCVPWRRNVALCKLAVERQAMNCAWTEIKIII